MKENKPLLRTNQKHKVSFMTRGIKVSHILRETTAEDLHLYEIERRDVMSIKGDSVDTKSRANAAKRKLWDLLTEKVEGYPFAGQNKWREKVPLQHKIQVVNTVNYVEILSEQEVTDQFGKDHLVMDWDKEAIYMAVDQDNGRLLVVHIFQQLEDADADEWDRLTALGKTKIKKNRMDTYAALITKPLIGLYNEKIIEVRGYQLGEKKEEKDDPVPGVPAFHREVAVKTLYRSMSGGLEKFEKN